MSIPDRNWQEGAACLEHPTPDVFFPEGATTHAHTQAALAYCRNCPVAAECLDAAQAEEADATRRMTFGIRGGLGPETRYQMRKGVAWNTP